MERAEHLVGERDAIVARKLSKVFTDNHGLPVAALMDMDLTVKKGEFLCIVGPSGCGKTTLLRILAHLEEPTSGELLIENTVTGKPVSSMVFQEQSLFPWYTVKANVTYGLTMRNVPRQEREEAADHFLKMTGLTKFAHAYPHQLSGGMKQRVSLARAFANDPSILLLDEPFASLDEQTRILLQLELIKIWEKTKKTLVFITHSIDEALGLGDRVLVMTARPGRTKEIIPVNLPRPRDLRAIRSDMRFLDLWRRVWSSLKQEVSGAQRQP